MDNFSTEKIQTARNTKRTTAQCKLSNGSPYLKRWLYLKLFLMIHKILELKLYYWVLMLRKTHLKSCICFSYIGLNKPNSSLSLYCFVLNYFFKYVKGVIFSSGPSMLSHLLCTGLCSSSPTTRCHQDFWNLLLCFFISTIKSYLIS